VRDGDVELALQPLDLVALCQLSRAEGWVTTITRRRRSRAARPRWRGRPGVSDLAAGVIGWLTASLAGVAVFALGVACSSYARARRAPSQ
jgi:hypothetical protein